jgi:hypothetical protein
VTAWRVAFCTSGGSVMTNHSRASFGGNADGVLAGVD